MAEKYLEGNPHWLRVLSFVQSLAAKHDATVRVERNCRNHQEYDRAASLCIRYEGRELDEEGIAELKNSSSWLYKESVVDDVSGFPALEPSLVDMAKIRTLFYKKEPYLGYVDKPLQQLSVIEVGLTCSFCSDSKEEVPLEPNKQLSLFPEEDELLGSSESPEQEDAR